MNKKTVSLSLIAAAGGILSVTAALPAFADNYDGPPVDLNFVNQPPAKYSICDKYQNDDTARRYSACEFGRDEAERTASRYAGGQGRIQGYLRGFSWGLYKSTSAYENDDTQISSGAAAIGTVGQYLQAGIDDGRQQGQSDGSAQGNSDAIDRFASVVDTGGNPDPTLRVPQTSYAGEDDAYQKHVGPVPTTQQIIQNDLQLGNLRVYDQVDSVFLSDVQPLSVWDLWRDDGIYTFEKSTWYDPQSALNVWFSRPVDTRPQYDQLNAGAPIDPATKQPMDLQAVFRDAYLGSYAYYVNYYFSSQFQQNLDMGMTDGDNYGVQVGKRVAYYKGLVRAFNEKFKASSASSYRQAFVGAYADGFNTTFQQYMTSPQLSIRFDEIVGAENDGIIEPGENIAVRFTVKNLGGVGTALGATLSGDVTNVNPQQFSIPRLRTMQYTSQVMGTIDPRLHTRDTAQVTLNVNGITAERDQLVEQMIAIENASASVDFANGNGRLVALAHNIATVRTPGIVTATLALNGVNVSTQQLGFVQSGDQAQVAISFGNLDPMDLIHGNVQAQLTVTMNGRVMDQAQVTISPDNAVSEMANYFNVLVNGKGFVPAPSSHDDRVAAVESELVQDNAQEVQANHKVFGPKPWRDSPASTVVGTILDKFHGSAQSEAAKSAYDKLARDLWQARTTFHKILFLFKSGKQKAYERLVQQLARTPLK